MKPKVLNKTKTISVFLGAVITFWLVESRAQNLLSNGSFEIPPHSTNSIVSLPTGSTNLLGWTIEGAGSVYLVTTPLEGWSFIALDGQQFIDFNHPTVTLSQSFATIAGESYEVTFSVGRFQGPTNMQVIAEVVSTNRDALGSLTVGVPETAGWSPPSRFRFTAADNTATLRFHGSNATVNVDLAMDAVTVERVTPRLTIEVSQVRLCWESQTNRIYQLQYRSDLATNTWTDLGPPIPGTGTRDCSEQPVTEPRRFYRIFLLP